MKKQKESHKVWNKNNPHNKITRGRYKDVIHHKDKDHDNDAPENQRKMPFGKHIKLHHTGAKRTKETKQKISSSLKGRKPTMLGKKHSEGTKRKISIAKIGTKCSEKTKKKMSESRKGRVFTDETKKKLSLAGIGNTNWVGKRHNKKSRKKMSETHRRIWAGRRKNIK